LRVLSVVGDGELGVGPGERGRLRVGKGLVRSPPQAEGHSIVKRWLRLHQRERNVERWTEEDRNGGQTGFSRELFWRYGSELREACVNERTVQLARL
jgi:hypothetical protein